MPSRPVPRDEEEASERPPHSATSQPSRTRRENRRVEVDEGPTVVDLTDAVGKEKEAEEAEPPASKIASQAPFTDDEDEDDESSGSQPSQRSPVKTPDADYDEERSPPSSDSEAEHEEAKEALKGLQELLDGLDRRIQASEVDKSVTKDVLLRAQMMIKQDGDGGVRRHAATSQRDPPDALTVSEPRQAREFMEEMGYEHFDQLRDGDSLVILCCRESVTR